MTLSRLFRQVSITMVVATGALTVAPVVSAYAGWDPGENQAVLTRYYSDATRTVVVGETLYGNCGNDYDNAGEYTQYLSRFLVDC